MRKRLLVVVLVGLAACGGGDDSGAVATTSSDASSSTSATSTSGSSTTTTSSASTATTAASHPISPAGQVMIDCIRSADPDVQTCTAAYMQLQASGEANVEMDAYNQCQTDHANGPATADECRAQAEALVQALGG